MNKVVKNDIDKCPHCGSTDGWYINEVLRHSRQFSFDGVPLGATELVFVRGGSVAYCAYCHRRLGYEQDMPRDDSLLDWSIEYENAN